MKKQILRTISVVFALVMMLAVFAGCDKQESTTPTTSPATEPTFEKIDTTGKLYWNVDKERFDKDAHIARVSVHGIYQIRLDTDGNREVLRFKDKSLVDKLDTLQLVTLETDAQGYISAVNPANEVAGANFVQAVTKDTVTCTADAGTDGAKVELKITSDTKVIVTSFDATEVKSISVLTVGSQITAVKNEAGAVTHIYIRVLAEEKGREAYCEACKQNVVWTAWKSGKMENGGHYYLENHINDLSSTISIKKDTVVCLDLNGKDIYSEGTDAVRLIETYGTLNLMDNAEVDGTLYSEIQKMAPVFYVKDGIFNIYGGNLKGATFTRSGVGAIGEDGQGILNMYGGTIYGGNATGGNGGNIEMFHDSILNLYGGTIKDGSASKNGGNVCGNKNAQINLLGGTITGGKAALGGGVYTQGAVTVGGDVKITENKDSDLFLAADQGVTIQDLKAEAVIGVTFKEGAGVLAQTAKESDAACFKATEGYAVQFADGKLNLVQG